MARAWAFVGQGAQHPGMGADLFDRFPDLCELADEVLGYSLRRLCLDDEGGRLRSTRYAQPALFVVNALGYLARREREPEPDFLLGHSLGEFDALFAAGVFDFETGLRLVARRGELMGAADGGGMLAVLGLGADEVSDLVARSGVADVDVANYNAPEQVVLSGPREAIDRIAGRIQERDRVRCVPLAVSAAFHSRQMTGAAGELGTVLEKVDFAAPRVPVIANVTARPYPVGGVGALLGQQIGSPVRWLDSLRYLMQHGVTEFVEIGPGRVLAGLWTEATRERRPAVRPARGPADLGSAEFRTDHDVRYAYAAGSMYQGISSVDLVVRMGHAGLLGFLGTGGLTLDEISSGLRAIQRELGTSRRYGANLLHDLGDPAAERRVVEEFLRHGVPVVEAAGFMSVTEPLVRYRFSGAHRAPDGGPIAPNRVIAKVSRPEVAAAFMSPPPAALLTRLVADGGLTAAEAEVAAVLPVALDICVEADSGGHTDGGVALALLPALRRLRDEQMRLHGYARAIRVGASGGLGSPEAVAAVFVLGADFVVTGSVNQCSPEAGTSTAVKDLLSTVDVQDTGYAPSGDLFELGARIQVVRRGTLFPARANRLYQLYRQHTGWDDLDDRTRHEVAERIFKRPVDDVWRETREHYLGTGRPEEVRRAEENPKHRLALLCKWYFAHSSRAAIAGDVDHQVDFQVHCGPAMGAFNRAVRGTDLADWRNRHVDAIAELLMRGAAEAIQGAAI